MTTQLTLNQSDIKNPQLNDKEKLAIVEAWSEFLMDRPVTINYKNGASQTFKAGVVDCLEAMMFGVKKFQEDLYHDFDANNEDDYSSLVNGMLRRLNTDDPVAIDRLV